MRPEDPHRDSGTMRYIGQFRPEYSRLHRDRDLLWVVPFGVRYVTAITGERFAGKSVVLNYLTEKKGFRVYSLANELRRIAVRRGLPLDPRGVLQDLGDEIRAENNDPAYLARLTLRRIHRDHQSTQRLSSPRRVAVAGFKRPEEIDVFEKLGNFRQLNIYAPLPVRFKRANRSGLLARELSHLRPRPLLTEETFERYIDQRDLSGHDNLWTEGFGQNVSDVVARDAAVPIENKHSLASLHTLLEGEVRKLDAEFRTATSARLAA
jgi:dephospho-CoA kinase